MYQNMSELTFKFNETPRCPAPACGEEWEGKARDYIVFRPGGQPRTEAYEEPCCHCDTLCEAQLSGPETIKICVV